MDLNRVPLAHHVARGTRFKSMPRYQHEKVGIRLGSDLFCFLSNQRAKNYGNHGLISWQDPARITATTDGVEQ